MYTPLHLDTCTSLIYTHNPLKYRFTLTRKHTHYIHTISHYIKKQKSLTHILPFLSTFPPQIKSSIIYMHTFTYTQTPLLYIYTHPIPKPLTCTHNRPLNTPTTTILKLPPYITPFLHTLPLYTILYYIQRHTHIHTSHLFN